MGIRGTYICLKSGRHGPDAYMPGDTVRGAVVLFISGSKPHKLSAVSLKVKGQARTKWTTNNGTWTTRHAETESFLKLELSVLRVAEGASTTLPPGENHLPFSFTLPELLPHSHEYTDGEVVYKCVAQAVSSQFWTANGRRKVPFTVLQRRDLNCLPHLSRRLVVERKSKNRQKRDDPGEFTVTLGRQGFVPGENIDIFVEGSDEVLRSLAWADSQVKLKRLEVFRAGSNCREHKPVLVKKRMGLEPTDWHHFQLTVPSDDIGTGPDAIRIITVSHYVKIWDVHLPVTLGTVPLARRAPSETPSSRLSGGDRSRRHLSSGRPTARSGSGRRPRRQDDTPVTRRSSSGASPARTPADGQEQP